MENIVLEGNLDIMCEEFDDYLNACEYGTLYNDGEDLFLKLCSEHYEKRVRITVEFLGNE